jgi:hemerythrin-like domain-containing protein
MSMHRRHVLQISAIAVSAMALPVRAQNNASRVAQDTVSPTENLMEEHGVLDRILLLYDRAAMQLSNGSFSPEVLHAAAGLIRELVEDHHERLEETYVFPRFAPRSEYQYEIQTLISQHRAGREVTDSILALSNATAIKDQVRRGLLIGALQSYTAMSRPHSSREETDVFPALRSVVSANEFSALREDFARSERRKFGEDGFGRMVERIAQLEQQAHLPELADVTPRPPATTGGDMGTSR